MIYKPREDSLFLARFVKKYAGGKSCLDVGTGSGILAKTALESGASSVLATDINPEAVKHVASQGIRALKSNLFSNVKGKFDLIIFNPPYLPEDKMEDKESKLVTTGGKKGDEIVIKFLQQAQNHLNKNGKILLLLSSLTPRLRIERTLRRMNLVAHVIGREPLFMEKLELLEIRRAQ